MRIFPERIVPLLTRVLILVVACVGIAGGVFGLAYWQTLSGPSLAGGAGAPADRRVVGVDEFRPMRAAPGPFPTLTKFPILAADRAAEVIGDEELVLGVEIDGVARAYPINALTGPSREIFNDRLAGRAIAATW